MNFCCYFFFSIGSAEEQIKQELQAVAEGVAACVFQSSLPSNPELHDKDESAFESNREEEAQNNTAGMPNRAKVEVFTNYLCACLRIFLSVPLSLSHTHTHTHIHFFK